MLWLCLPSLSSKRVSSRLNSEVFLDYSSTIILWYRCYHGIIDNCKFIKICECENHAHICGCCSMAIVFVFRSHKYFGTKSEAHYLQSDFSCKCFQSVFFSLYFIKCVRGDDKKKMKSKGANSWHSRDSYSPVDEYAKSLATI